MDYLERLEQSLKQLEQEANELSQLPALIQALGITADNLSKEKEEFRNASNAFQDYRGFEQYLKKMENTLNSNEEDIKVLCEEFSRETNNLKQKMELLEEKYSEESKEIQRKADYIWDDFRRESRSTQEKLLMVNNSIEENHNAIKKVTTLIIVCIIIMVITCGISIASMLGVG